MEEDFLANSVFAFCKALVLLVRRNVDSNRKRAFALIRHLMLDFPLAFQDIACASSYPCIQTFPKDSRTIASVS
jgi:hypothetical protein